MYSSSVRTHRCHEIRNLTMNENSNRRETNKLVVRWGVIKLVPLAQNYVMIMKERRPKDVFTCVYRYYKALLHDCTKIRRYIPVDSFGMSRVLLIQLRPTVHSPTKRAHTCIVRLKRAHVRRVHALRRVRAIGTKVARTGSPDCEISFSEPAICEIDGAICLPVIAIQSSGNSL